ncbi:hypothetical protein [uncultured Duncaniella sp.]|uniref:hypothetical protein n=1 Tax=uncultured Duncaniella sp. TaxID=2768039 RepID=UPI00272F62FB|nr:hypothetical protein [uncultured Duncaniella sp.]
MHANLLPMTRMANSTENPQKSLQTAPQPDTRQTARDLPDTQKKRPGEALNSPPGAPDALQTLHQSLHHP